MSSKKWRWGIIGSGAISQDFARSLQFSPDAEVVAVGARNLRDAEIFATKFPNYNITPYGGYEDLLRDPKVEIVYVGVLNPFHKEAAILALQHNKHVLVEKPFTINSKEAQEVFALAAQNKLFIMEAMWTRFFPAIQKVREILQSGILGEVTVVTADFGYKGDDAPRLRDPTLGGGILLDVGVYPIALASMIYGGTFPSKIMAAGELWKSGTDETSVFTLCYKPGQFASLYASAKADTPTEAWIIGTKGRIKIHFPFWSPEKITLYVDDKEQNFEFPVPQLNGMKSFNFTNTTGMHYEANHVMQCLQEGKLSSPIMPPQESVVIMKIMDEIRKQIGVVYPEDKQ